MTLPELSGCGFSLVGLCVAIFLGLLLGLNLLSIVTLSVLFFFGGVDVRCGCVLLGCVFW